MTPIDVHGAWTRRWATVDGGPAFETQRVFWLQAESCYADVRVPFHPAADERCFTGRSGWAGHQYRWTHHLDLEPGSPSSDDTGRLEWVGDVLLEQGMFPTAEGAVPYQEGWVQLGSDGPYLALESPTDVMVRVGGHALSVSDQRAAGGGFAAAYWCRNGAGWQIGAAIGDAAALLGPDDGIPPGWTVVEKGQRAGVRR